MNNEAHIPAKQSPPQENAWISQTHENRQRPKSPQTPPPCRPKSPRPLISCKFPKRLKLRKRFEFLKTTRQGQRLVGRFLCVDWRPSGLSETRLGLTVSSKYADAHERNLFKRRVREAFRSSRASLPAGLDINVVPRQLARKATLSEIRFELMSLLGASHVAKS